MATATATATTRTPPSEREGKLLEFMRDYQCTHLRAPTFQEMQDHLGGLSQPTVMAAVLQLCVRGLVKEVGSLKSGRRFVAVAKK